MNFNFFFLREHAGAAGLDRLDLGLAPGQTAEASGKLSAVEELASSGLDGAQGRAGHVADAAGGEGSATERAVLLSLGSVGGEGVRESSGGRGGVDTRSVIHRLGDGALAQEADQRGAGSVAESGSGVHCDGDGLRCGGRRSISRECAKFNGPESIRADPDATRM